MAANGQQREKQMGKEHMSPPPRDIQDLENKVKKLFSGLHLEYFGYF